MQIPPKELLARLGAGESIANLCSAAGLSREEFDVWWKRECAARVPASRGTRPAAVVSSVRIERDEWGIPHVFAESDEDLFFGFGYATAQDRLFQLDYLRRRAVGRLAEVVGPDGVETDQVARTIGLHRTSESEWRQLPAETKRLLQAYAAGVNALLDETRDNLPIEFDLLGYTPEAWRPQDCLAIAGEFRWYLTGRFPVIVIPELAKRALGNGPLYEAFLQAEADAEAILPPGAYPRERCGVDPVPEGNWRQPAITPSAEIPPGGRTNAGPAQFQEPTGSNNWVVSGAKSVSGKPLVASDPHIAFAAVSCWHEVRLCGGSFNVAGIAYAGMPAILFGRNERVAWGITNNICSLRDLYQERTSPAHPGCFLYEDQWEPARETIEIIAIKGQNSVKRTVRFSRNGPIVDEILPPQARHTGPVALKWLGAAYCGWIPALLQMDRAKSGEELRRATEPWLVPTFCVVYGDVDGHIGYQCTGRIPIRNIRERGYRPGWDPRHQWAGLIPFEGMPRWSDPQREWIGTANNRVAADDFPYPLSGTWSSGHRGLRVRQMLEEQPSFNRQDFTRLHQDSASPRAIECVPHLLSVLRAALEAHDARASEGRQPLDTFNQTLTSPQFAPFSDHDAHRLRMAIDYLSLWDYRVEPDRVAASIFNVFFAHWSQRIAEERFPSDIAAFVAPAMGGLANSLLRSDEAGWFEKTSREGTIVKCLFAALDLLTTRFGSNPVNWGWGRLHTLQQKHFLSGRGDLGALFDRGEVAVRGDMVTVCNTGQAPDFSAPTGAGYRLIADLADPQGGLWAIDAGSESGHPGSPHYDDQLPNWLTARYHYLSLARGEESQGFKTTRLLTPTVTGAS